MQSHQCRAAGVGKGAESWLLRGTASSSAHTAPLHHRNDVLPLGTSLLGGDQKHRASPAALLQQQSSDSEILDVLKILLQKLQAQPGAQRAAFNLSASERGKPPHPTPCTALGGKRGTRRVGTAERSAAFSAPGAELRSPRVYFCTRKKGVVWGGVCAAGACSQGRAVRRAKR